MRSVGKIIRSAEKAALAAEYVDRKKGVVAQLKSASSQVPCVDPTRRRLEVARETTRNPKQVSTFDRKDTGQHVVPKGIHKAFVHISSIRLFV